MIRKQQRDFTFTPVFVASINHINNDLMVFKGRLDSNVDETVMNR